MGLRLSPRARADVDEMAYYVAVQSGSLEPADRLLESIYKRFQLTGGSMAGVISDLKA
jgi:plasmid stabilization system protein ParE